MELTLLSLVSSQMGIIVSSSKRAEKVSEMTGVLLLLQINIKIKHSVADLDPGSGAFLTPRSEIRDPG